MSSWKVIAVALAMTSSANGSMESRDESASAGMSESRAGGRADLLFTWSSTDRDVDLLHTWARPGEAGEMRLAFWQLAEARPMLVTFSSPELERDFVLTWSSPDVSRLLLFTWSNPLVAAEEEGAAGGEPRRR